MPIRVLRAPSAPIDFAAIRAELGIPDAYPADAQAEAERSAGRQPRAGLDATTVPLVTLDPPGSLDLDQAMQLERTDTGYRVRYAIADVAAWVAPHGPLDAETRRRGVTLYSPDVRTPLHPTVLSEAAASLLPDQDRPAVLWTIALDHDAEPTAVDVRRATVRSVAKLDYPTVQAQLDDGGVHPSIALLPEIGRLRVAAARRRNAITLNMPDVEVVPERDGRWSLHLRAQPPIERFNAEISLLTGICAARIMLAGGVGLLRTLPRPTREQVRALRRSTAALGIHWPTGMPPGNVIDHLDPDRPKDAAFLEDAVHLLRGAGYTAFDGSPPERPTHAGVGAPYAHVTAPLRRLADRFATEVCLALVAGQDVPAWARDALGSLPQIMDAADRKDGELQRACTEAVSALLLSGREGEVFDATVLQVDLERGRATVVLDDPPVRAHCAADGLVEGSRAKVRLATADPGAHSFLVEPVGH